MKIAIKLPDDLKEKLLYFPFLQAWVKHYLALEKEENLVVHFISSKESLDVLNLLPFNAYFHQIGKDDRHNVFTIHRYAKNLRLRDVDVYISLTQSFLDAVLGASIGAKKRIGFADSSGNIFFNQKIPALVGRHPSEKLVVLFKLFDSELSTSNLRAVTSRRLEWQHDGLENRKYWVLNLGLDLSGEIDTIWADFLDLFDNEIFVLLCEDLELSCQGEKLKEFIKKLNTNNEYIIFEKQGHIDFAKLVSSCNAFLGYDTDLVYLAAYCAPKVFYIREKAQFDQSDFSYFLSDIKVFNLSEPIYGGRINKAFDEVIAYVDSVKREEL